jgi:DNA-binding NarL/FixJ family response regulator
VEKIKILIADDHAGVREGISALVKAQSDMIVIGEAANGAEAIQQFKTLRPDITLADVNLPVLGGVEAMGLICAEFPEALFIVISALYHDGCISEAFRAGARAYLNKDCLRRELLPAIRAVCAGQQYVPKDVV